MENSTNLNIDYKVKVNRDNLEAEIKTFLFSGSHKYNLRIKPDKRVESVLIECKNKLYYGIFENGYYEIPLTENMVGIPYKIHFKILVDTKQQNSIFLKRISSDELTLNLKKDNLFKEYDDYFRLKGEILNLEASF